MAKIDGLDGLCNIQDRHIICLTQALEFFAQNDLASVAEKKGWSKGDMLQALAAPLHSITNEYKRSFIFSIPEKKVKTKTGKDASPAIATYTVTMGLSLTENDNFALTSTSQMILNHSLSIPSYALMLLSKVGIYVNDKRITNLLTQFCKYAKKNCFESYTKDNFRKILLELGENATYDSRDDIAFNAFVLSGILSVTGDEKYEVKKEDKDLIELLATEGDKISIPINGENYMGDVTKGIIELITPKNKICFSPKYNDLISIKLGENEVVFPKINNLSPIQQIFYGSPGTGKSYKVSSLIGNYQTLTPINCDFDKELNKYFGKFSSSQYIDFLKADVNSDLYSNIIGKKCCRIIDCYDVDDIDKLYNSFLGGGILSGLNINSVPSGALMNYKKFLETIEFDIKSNKNLVFRTTFHPDYDYAQFVGCYKPIKQFDTEKNKVLLSYDSLVEKFKEYLNIQPINITKACTLFGYQFHDSIIKICETNHSVQELVNKAYKEGTTYSSQVFAGMAAYESSSAISSTPSQITYEFIPQVFTNAYIEAYKNPEKQVYLVIEEINRGNCAQIFGDLFQLLDRNDNGESEYAINVDEDLKNYLEKNCPTAITEGKIKLPSNFNIIATMNTSDQSLFPMDSAFKRRWDWECVPIDYNEEKSSQFVITIGTQTYLWVDFLKKVNEKIKKATLSEDKQMGNFFIKGNIDEKTFINKVMFYLWNDVCKENFNTTDNFFRHKKDETDENPIEFSFNQLFDKKGNTAELLQGFMRYLDVAVAKDTVTSNDAEESKATESESTQE